MINYSSLYAFVANVMYCYRRIMEFNQRLSDKWLLSEQIDLIYSLEYVFWQSAVRYSEACLFWLGKSSLSWFNLRMEYVSFISNSSYDQKLSDCFEITTIWYPPIFSKRPFIENDCVGAHVIFLKM